MIVQVLGDAALRCLRLGQRELAGEFTKSSGPLPNLILEPVLILRGVPRRLPCAPGSCGASARGSGSGRAPRRGRAPHHEGLALVEVDDIDADPRTAAARAETLALPPIGLGTKARRRTRRGRHRQMLRLGDLRVLPGRRQRARGSVGRICSGPSVLLLGGSAQRLWIARSSLRRSPSSHWTCSRTSRSSAPWTRMSMRRWHRAGGDAQRRRKLVAHIDLELSGRSDTRDSPVPGRSDSPRPVRPRIGANKGTGRCSDGAMSVRRQRRLAHSVSASTSATSVAFPSGAHRCKSPFAVSFPGLRFTGWAAALLLASCASGPRVTSEGLPAADSYAQPGKHAPGGRRRSRRGAGSSRPPSTRRSPTSTSGAAFA